MYLITLSLDPHLGFNKIYINPSTTTAALNLNFDIKILWCCNLYQLLQPPNTYKLQLL